MIANGMEVQIAKVCSMGLRKEHMGKSIAQLRDHFLKLKDDFQFNVCGEGGEYESAVFDCPLFKTHKIQCSESKVVLHDDNPVQQTAYLQYTKLEVVPLSKEEIEKHTLILSQLKEKYSEIPTEHLGHVDYAAIENSPLNGEAQAMSHQIERVTLSVKIIKGASVSEEEVKKMSQKEQLLVIMEHLKASGKLSNVVKVGLLINDLGQFKDLNAEYVKYFGLKPPVRVCV
mmetsp:Transcript_5524/g.9412  ORF Transcript_5524/g.9412 Transcript_5524/m.9412 type:complete len:229 (+) Transcript_5524:506-1192(+)